jgi:putative phosphoribosyl transferase
MFEGILKDRRDAGRRLARLLEKYKGARDCLVIALPRGGVEVGVEIARELKLPMEVCVVRKLGVPFQPEMAMGAVSLGGVEVIDEDLIHDLGISHEELEREIAIEREELNRRERAYRDERPLPVLRGRTVIVADDGVATGATMKAALGALRRCGASRLVVAVGVAAPGAHYWLARLADEFYAALEPARLNSIGEWYADFRQLRDEEVKALLRESAEGRSGNGDGGDGGGGNADGRSGAAAAGGDGWAVRDGESALVSSGSGGADA